MPYEWFDTPNKLDYDVCCHMSAGTPISEKEYILTEVELEECKRVFADCGMKTFKYWLHYNKDLDVAPRLEALVKMFSFYGERGIDIFKDAVSILGVFLQYLLQNTSKGPNAPELYAPGLEVYEMLRGAVMGGPSIAFTCHHEADKTYIRPHEVSNPKMRCKVLGFEKKTLYMYLSTMFCDMPCSKETVTHYRDPVRTWFGFVECDVTVTPELREKFTELPLFFYNKIMCSGMVPKHMKEYQHS